MMLNIAVGLVASDAAKQVRQRAITALLPVLHFPLLPLWPEGTKCGARSAVRTLISCAQHTKTKDTSRTLTTGWLGTRTRMPWLLAASQMWYCPIKSSREMRPNHAKKVENLDLKGP